MKKFLFLSILGCFALSVTAANISSSPPIQEQSITFPVFITEQYNDVCLTNVNVEYVVSEEIQHNFNLSGVFTPTMRAGFVYHPLDYEVLSSGSATINSIATSYSNSIQIKCRSDVFPAVSIPIFS